MSAINETIVREYFELHGFLVRQHRKYVAPVRKQQDEEDDFDFFVLNPLQQTTSKPLPIVLSSGDLPRVHRAIVVVKGWHTETFSQARLSNTPTLFRFVEEKVFQQASRAFGADGAPSKILVLPALPTDANARDQSIALLRSKGIDSVLPFRTILADLVDETQSNRNYEKSDLLQVIRILKNYDFIKEPQLEFFKARRKRATKRPHPAT
jgi:hypothetical protein